VDCLGTLLGLAMEAAWPQEAGAEKPADSADALRAADADLLPDGYETAVRERFEPAVRWLSTRRGDTIVVTNEVGDGVVPQWASARLFRDELGRANRALVEAADSSYLCVAGRLLPLSRVATEATWPED